MFYEEYSSEVFIERLQNLSLPDFVQSETAQMNNYAIVQVGTAQLPAILYLTTFTNHIEILNRCKTVEQRIFYILYAYRERLKNKELQRCIAAGLKQVYPQSPSLIKDRAFVDFLSLPEKHNERQLHKGLLDHMKQFVLELGKDFLYIDSEYPLQVGGSMFKVDLLFYHRGLQCLVAIELKAKKFKPEYMGQLEFYLEALDRDVKRSNENPSIGILLCQSADQSVVEYAMSRSLSPTMVAEYHRQLIPKEVVQKSLEEFCSFLKDIKGK